MSMFEKWLVAAIFGSLSWLIAACLYGNIDGNHQETARMCLQHKFEPKLCKQFTEVP